MNCCPYVTAAAAAAAAAQVHTLQPERRARLWRWPAHRQDAGHACGPAGTPQVQAYKGAPWPGLPSCACHALPATPDHTRGPEELEDPARHLELEEPE
eukprot:scaffold190826_cov21-Tisochrysis_lutea.AAC.2